MHPAAKILKETLIATGWHVTPGLDTDAWWADESWQLERGGVTVLLTFLVDPQADVHRRKKGERLWAVKASAHFPRQWQTEAGEIMLDFGAHWRRRIPAFVRSLECFRTKKLNPEQRSAAR